MKLIDRVFTINWNRVRDDKDAEVWDRLTGTFWLPEKSRCPNDTPSWGTLTVHENQLTMRMFHGPDAARHHPGHRPLDVDFLCCRYIDVLGRRGR